MKRELEVTIRGQHGGESGRYTLPMSGSGYGHYEVRLDVPVEVGREHVGFHAFNVRIYIPPTRLDRWRTWFRRRPSREG